MIDLSQIQAISQQAQKGEIPPYCFVAQYESEESYVVIISKYTDSTPEPAIEAAETIVSRMEWPQQHTWMVLDLRNLTPVETGSVDWTDDGKGIAEDE